MILTTKKEKKLRAEIDDLKIENGALKTFSGTMESNNNHFCNLMTELRAEISRLKAENEKLKQRNPQMILTTKKEKKLRAEISRLKAERDTLEGHLGYSESKNRGLNVQCIDFADKIHELKAEAEQLKKQNRNMINVLNDENDLLLENEQLKADLRIANKNWIKRYDELKTESNKLEADNEKLRNNLKTTTDRCNWLDNFDTGLKDEIKELKEDNKQLGAKINELNHINREWITMYEKLEEEAEQLKKENEESGYTCATLKREFVNTCSELRAENDRLISNHVWKLTDRCAELKKANNEMGDMCAELRAENSKLEEEGHISRIDLEHFIRRTEKLEAELKELKGGDSD